MSDIFILGGSGFTGSRIARHLLETSDARVTLAGRHGEAAARLAEALNGQWPGRARGVAVDAADGAALRTALSGHAMIVVAAPTTADAETVARAALATGVDYLDVQIGARKLAMLKALAPEIEAAGRCFITEAGFHPGLPSLLVRYAAARLDTIESVLTAGYLNMGRNLPYTPGFDELAEEFRAYQAQTYCGGQWSKPGAWQIRRIDFGGDIGRKLCFSMFFEELRDLPAAYPSLSDLGFYMSESHWLSDWVIVPAVMLWLKLFPAATHGAGLLIWWSMKTFNRPPVRVELMVEAKGKRGGRPATIRASVSHTDGYELTAIPVVATLLQYLEGKRPPGLWMMGHVGEPARAMADMERMGVRRAEPAG